MMPDAATLRTRLVLAMQFLTRLPVKGPYDFDPEEMVRATRHFPVIGALIGTITALTYMLGLCGLPPLVAAILATGLTIIVTGGLHEDGLADFADGLGGGRDRDSRLQIMRDSRIGTHGALALGIIVSLHVAALAGLSASQAALGLVTAHLLGRVAMVHMMKTQPYARRTGAAAFAADGLDDTTYRIACLWAALALLLILIADGFGMALMALFCVALPQWVIGRIARSRLEGYTGDVLGAVQQSTTAAVLIGFLAWH
ncbi:adenosylcobinamide-GDP ribazoletransferase [Qingshengfaniella alkalisoli]|uniref:Adenosylcobinamide-GDP ribazoletransferase n=1 Tax=Qingshengfaniella alkalisoli TaxID=2599296 RepID=A0A5B8J4U0_9RHOB|nr:adenosylcobinamide-GDP ribazoletransferase [Qingshengfaniella alkalisoli]QDY69557.1 adenosylcobinamide-GDP ribazoletransferase [Qingshengfaniella alkalisoli]